MRKIAIVGSSPSTWELAPFQDPDWEIWGLAWRRGLPKADVLFDIHDPHQWHHHGGVGYVNYLIEKNLPIYVREPLEGLPTHLVYPQADVLRDLAPEGSECDFLTSSIAFMTALAICQKPDVIGIWGSDMAAGDEYDYQRPAMLYLIGLARGRDIEVYVPPQSVLTKANFVYGAKAGPAIAPATGITEAILVKRLEKYHADREATQGRINAEINRMNTLDGAIGEAEQLLEMVRFHNRGGVIPS